MGRRWEKPENDTHEGRNLTALPVQKCPTAHPWEMTLRELPPGRPSVISPAAQLPGPAPWSKHPHPLNPALSNLPDLLETPHYPWELLCHSPPPPPPLPLSMTLFPRPDSQLGRTVPVAFSMLVSWDSPGCGGHCIRLLLRLPASRCSPACPHTYLCHSHMSCFPRTNINSQTVHQTP